MRDLLYLSESKMATLVPQLPGRVRRRLGLEAGLNFGIASIKATLASEAGPDLIAALDAVIDMIEHRLPSRWRTAADVRPGDWIQFDEILRIGDGWPGSDHHGPEPVHGLVYFAAVEEPDFVMIGSGVHVKDRRQLQDQRTGHTGYAGFYYMEALRAYARQLADLADEGAVSDFIRPVSPRTRSHRPSDLSYSLEWMCSSARHDYSGGHESWASAPIVLRGHARVLEVLRRELCPPRLVATPLYVEYSPRD